MESDGRGVQNQINTIVPIILLERSSLAAARGIDDSKSTRTEQLGQRALTMGREVVGEVDMQLESGSAGAFADAVG